MEEAGQIALSVIISLVATMLASFGIAIQQKSHLLKSPTNPAVQYDPNPSFIVKNLWYFGFGIYLVSSLTSSIFSIGTLPVTLLAPIGAFSLICNALFARILLNDRWSWQSGLGTLIISFGAVMIALFGVIKEQNRSLEDLMKLYQRTQFIIYFTIQEVIIITILTYNHLNESKLLRHIKSLGHANPTKLPYPTLTLATNRTVIGLIYGACSILISTQGILFAKSGIELLTLTILGNNQFDRPLAWIIVALLIITALLQLIYLNRSLIYTDIVILMPANFCTYNVSCLINGLVYFNQWSELTHLNLMLVIVGTVILSLGVVLLSFRPKQQPITLDSANNLQDEEDNEFANLVINSINNPISSNQSTLSRNNSLRLKLRLSQPMPQPLNVLSSIQIDDDGFLSEQSPLLTEEPDNSPKYT